MGSSLSAARGAAARRPPQQARVPKAPNVVRASPSPSPPPPHERANADEWARTLNQMSHIIRSSSWHDESTRAAEPHAQQHAARRSDATTHKLPQQRSVVQPTHERSGERRAASGRLSQTQLTQLFKLRREAAQRWHARALGEHFGVAHDDVEHLLRYTRTYTARLDADGLVRGYYNADVNNTIVRFEKD